MRLLKIKKNSVIDYFKIAGDTGQSFEEVAKAATEFSRQGLGFEQTLKRTSSAMILMRLSGLGAKEAVESLTAAVKQFSKKKVLTMLLSLIKWQKLMPHLP